MKNMRKKERKKERKKWLNLIKYSRRKKKKKKKPKLLKERKTDRKKVNGINDLRDSAKKGGSRIYWNIEERKIERNAQSL